MGMQKVVIIGAGNVAWHLSKAIDKVADVMQVYARRLEQAKEIASQLLNAKPIDNLLDIDNSADLYLLCVGDKAITEIVDNMPKVKGIVAHTSGSANMEYLAKASKRYGVLYPLQTFTKGVELDISKISFFTEGNNIDTLLSLDEIASLISPKAKVNHATSEQRRMLHIAAVFGCNFVNHMWTISEEILQNNGYDMSVLYPLMEVTLKKAMEMSPKEAQTGPAIRHDQNTINTHLRILPSDLKTIYQELTDSIQNISRKP